VTLTEEQVRAIDDLDAALCQFLNNVGDEYDPRVWIPSIKRNFADLAVAYNECHKAGVMDLIRAIQSVGYDPETLRPYPSSKALSSQPQKGKSE